MSIRVQCECCVIPVLLDTILVVNTSLMTWIILHIKYTGTSHYFVLPAELKLIRHIAHAFWTIHTITHITHPTVFQVQVYLWVDTPGTDALDLAGIGYKSTGGGELYNTEFQVPAYLI